MTDPENPVHIRRIGPTDEAQWRVGYAAFWRHFDRELDAGVYDLTWQRLHDPAENMVAFGAFEAGKLLGLAHVVSHRSFSAVGHDHYMQHLFVAPEARRRGIGRALIEHIYDVVEKAGGHRVYWNTPADNPAAIQLYDRIGSYIGYRLYRKEFLKQR
ncbi:MAG: GNAT family N-acetyltransferase [Rhabdaerophilum sp.]